MNHSEKLDFDHITALMSLISEVEANAKQVDTTLLRQQLDCELHQKPIRYDLTKIDDQGKGEISGQQS